MNKGFIALFSVIIITAILLLAAASLSFTGFSARFNILDTELKSTSDALADGCLDQAMLNVASGVDYEGEVEIGEEVCEILSVINDDEATIFTKGSYKNANTYYKATVNTDTFEFSSFEELSTYP
jgi:hypothetical protein